MGAFTVYSVVNPLTFGGSITHMAGDGLRRFPPFHHALPPAEHVNHPLYEKPPAKRVK